MVLKEDKLEIVFYGGGVDERLSCTTEDEYMESVLDDMPIEEWPEVIAVSSYVRLIVSLREVEMLDDVLERLDEDYADPEGFVDSFTATDEMYEAEKVLQDLILKHYKPWMCKDVGSKEINVKEWVTENRPHWLEDQA